MVGLWHSLQARMFDNNANGHKCPSICIPLFYYCWSSLAYEDIIFLVLDNDKPTDRNRELLLRPPITKSLLGQPRRKRIESQMSIVCELHCSKCHEAGHDKRSCNAPVVDNVLLGLYFADFKP